jgi:hypothetical protein
LGPGDLYEHPLDYYHRLRRGCYCKTSSPRPERAVGFYPYNDSRNRGCVRCHLPRAGNRLVSR